VAPSHFHHQVGNAAPKHFTIMISQGASALRVPSVCAHQAAVPKAVVAPKPAAPAPKVRRLHNRVMQHQVTSLWCIISDVDHRCVRRGLSMWHQVISIIK
jgi:F420-0:gamma-glutamyl ligase